jgi:hypothetical protein
MGNKTVGIVTSYTPKMIYLELRHIGRAPPVAAAPAFESFYRRRPAVPFL